MRRIGYRQKILTIARGVLGGVLGIVWHTLQHGWAILLLCLTLPVGVVELLLVPAAFCWGFISNHYPKWGRFIAVRALKRTSDRLMDRIFKKLGKNSITEYYFGRELILPK